MNTPQTFASHITVCKECGTEVQHLVSDCKGGKPYLQPCGHAATLAVIPNPKLPR